MDTMELLEDEGIGCILGDNIPPFDLTFSGSTVLHEYEIRIHPTDFERAHEILEDWARNLMYDVDKDHYLFEFKDEELYEILLKPDEWSTHDYTLARKILEQRGVVVDEGLLKSLRKERIKELAQPEKGQRVWIATGYIMVLLGLVFFYAWFFGLIIGYFLWKSKKTLPNGERIYTYSLTDRTQGRMIFVLSLILLPIYLVIFWTEI